MLAGHGPSYEKLGKLKRRQENRTVFQKCVWKYQFFFLQFSGPRSHGLRDCDGVQVYSVHLVERILRFLKWQKLVPLFETAEPNIIHVFSNYLLSNCFNFCL